MRPFAVTKASLRDDLRVIKEYCRDAEAALKANDLEGYVSAMEQAESLASASRWAASSGE